MLDDTPPISLTGEGRVTSYPSKPPFDASSKPTGAHSEPVQTSNDCRSLAKKECAPTQNSRISISSPGGALKVNSSVSNTIPAFSILISLLTSKMGSGVFDPVSAWIVFSGAAKKNMAMRIIAV